MERCRLCNDVFQRKRKLQGLDRRLVTSKLRKTETAALSAMQEMYAYEGPSNGYICGQCFIKVEKGYRVYTHSHTFKTIKSESPTLTHKKSPQKKTTILNTAASIAKALQNSKYYTAFRAILSRGDAAEKAFRKLVKRRVQREVKMFSKENNYPQFAGSHSIETFQWAPLLSSMETTMPTLYTSIHSAMPTLPEEKYSSTITPRMGFLMSVPLYSRNPKAFNFLQALTGVQMWRCGSSEKLFRSFNKLGLCQSSSAIRSRIQKLCEEPDLQINKWKQALENTEDETKIIQPVVNVNDQQDVNMSSKIPTTTSAQGNENLHLTSSEDEWEDITDDDDDDDYEPMLVDTDTSLDIETTEDESNIEWSTDDNQDSNSNQNGCGYSLVWDNTQMLVHTRNQTRDNQNTMKLWANCYAAKNRVEPKGLDNNNLTLSAYDIPMSAYFHNSGDEEMLRLRMETIVSRIIVKNIPHFHQFERHIQWHLPHEHDEESAQKTELINIGIIEANPSSTDGVIDICQNLHKYVPRQQDGSYRVVPTHGDALTVERMLDAKKARSVEHSDYRRLDGLTPTPQEFHHRGLMLQNTMNNMFHNSSINERGTLAQLKNDFKHRNVTKDVMNSFNHVEDFIRFVTEAHICYLVADMLDMEDLNSTPSTFASQTSLEENLSMLKTLCKKIVRDLWSLTPDSDIQAVLEANEEDHQLDWCFCGEEKEDSMVKCSSSSCTHGTWFHISCKEMAVEDIPPPEADWWCSQDCKDTGDSCHCKCRKIRPGPTIKCARGEECPYGLIFHLDCVQLSVIPDEKWFCSRMCSEECGQSQDFIQNYAIGITWNGLLDLCHRDMIREADGPAMISMWRLNVPRFWSGNHYKYLIIAHRLLAGENGWLPPRLMEEIRNNRTVNLRGGKGNNIAKDRVNEFMNKDFKDILKHCNGQYSSETVQRAGRIVGPLGEAIDRAFDTQIAQTKQRRSYRKRANYQKDIADFVEEYRSDKLFHYIPGRYHESYPTFKCDQHIKDPGKLRSRLVKYTDKIERSRNPQ